MTPTPSPADFVRSFAVHWSAHDAAALAELCAEDAEMLTLTGGWCEGRKAIEDTLGAEFSGIFSKARLVTGKARLRMLGPGATVIHQRYVLSGLVNGEGQDLGRVSALMMAVLLLGNGGWRAVTLQFSAVES